MLGCVEHQQPSMNTQSWCQQSTNCCTQRCVQRAAASSRERRAESRGAAGRSGGEEQRARRQWRGTAFREPSESKAAGEGHSLEQGLSCVEVQRRAGLSGPDGEQG